MMLDQLTNSEGFKVLASLITGGAFVGWYREYRRGRKDIMTFTLTRIEQYQHDLQAERQRVDALVQRMSDLEVQHSEDRAGYREALARKDVLLLAKDVEIQRLKNELAMHAPRTTPDHATIVTTTPPTQGATE